MIGLAGEKVKLAMGGLSGGGVISTLAVAEWVRAPLVALTTTLQLLVPPEGAVFEAEMISAAVNIPAALRVNELDVRVAVGEGAPEQQVRLTLTVRVPVPENWFRLVSVTLGEAEVPVGISSVCGLREIEKSGVPTMVTVTTTTEPR
jgi:hypothetical protein